MYLDQWYKPGNIHVISQSTSLSPIELDINLLETAVSLVSALGRIVRLHGWYSATCDISVMNGLARSRHLRMVKTMDEGTKTS